METKPHWDQIYSSRSPGEVSWFQEHARVSLELIKRASPSNKSSIIDVGAGASTLIADLLNAGYRNLTVLDISAEAVSVAQQQLSHRQAEVTWIVGDITQTELPSHHFDLWHDRAVFHFLTSQSDREAYVKSVRQSVKPGGHVIVATFGENGPTQCSGLDVVRYSADELHGEFGEEFQLLDHIEENHQTPFGSTQQFVYCYCRLRN